MIHRSLSEQIKLYVQKFPIIAITGPRQSGKTTLVKNIFPDYTYVTFEETDKRQYAMEDPKGFLNQYSGKLIIDEAQYVPELFSYIQVYADNNAEMGQYILTGSQNFLLMEKISQSLAGRVALFNLLPFSYQELKNTSFGDGSFQSFILNGFYPAIYDRNLKPGEWYPNYLSTYIERDVRQTLNVGNLMQFRQFMQMCAGSVGQLINFSAIGNALGVSNNTIKQWISVLETSFIAFRLPPYFNNVNKRIIKSPKLYFYDTGLACDLLGIYSEEQFNTHFAKGALFENFIITELLKCIQNNKLNSRLYFWRESNGNEIDCIIDKGINILPLEIKSSQTINSSFFKVFDYFERIIKTEKPVLIYGGDDSQFRTGHEVLSWRSINEIINRI